MAPGRVTAVHGAEAAIEVDGRRRVVSILVEPDVRVGEWVIVAGSLVIRRLDADTASEITDAVELASAARPSEPPQPIGAPR
ncbi:MAG TPA: HypC/HybG/HupF family hydrogenase formation chaperone [Candidatus Baltobacteraceae bacterium]|nr:HypC/HybG/HupF family hydrogenase formation chaperone [Candidatus Baltobacteraceae bacterium]